MKWISFNPHQWKNKIQPALEQWRASFDQCILCSAPRQQIRMLCTHCYQDLVCFDFERCQGNLLNWPAIARIIKKPVFDELICFSAYQWPVSDWLTQLKFKQRFDLAELLADLLTNYIKEQQCLALENSWLCVPVAPSTWRKRGYNQAHLIARSLCAKLKVNYLENALFKAEGMISQVGQSGAQRRRNLRGTFSLNQTASLPEKVILFDDVLTTGATVNEITKLLKQNGVKHVTVVTVAISLPVPI